MKMLLTSIAAALLMTSCMTVDSVSVNQVPEKSQRHSMIHAHASSPVILLIPFGSGFVDEARANLTSQCPHGAIEGLLSKQETTDYFLTLVMVQSVTMEGYCVQAHNSTGKTHGKRKA